MKCRRFITVRDVDGVMFPATADAWSGRLYKVNQVMQQHWGFTQAFVPSAADALLTVPCLDAARPQLPTKTELVRVSLRDSVLISQLRSYLTVQAAFYRQVKRGAA